MTLLETTEIISEYAEVRVFNCNGDEIARYNGKDSIPSHLNRETVDNISAGIDYFGNRSPFCGRWIHPHQYAAMRIFREITRVNHYPLEERHILQIRHRHSVFPTHAHLYFVCPKRNRSLPLNLPFLRQIAIGRLQRIAKVHPFRRTLRHLLKRPYRAIRKEMFPCQYQFHCVSIFL